MVRHTNGGLPESGHGTRRPSSPPPPTGPGIKGKGQVEDDSEGTKVKSYAVWANSSKWHENKCSPGNVAIMLVRISRQAPRAKEMDLMVRERAMTVNAQRPQDKNSFHTGQWGPLSEALATCDHRLSLSRCNRGKQISNVGGNCYPQSEQSCHPPCEQNLGSPLPRGVPTTASPQAAVLAGEGGRCLPGRKGRTEWHLNCVPLACGEQPKSMSLNLKHFICYPF